MMMSENVLNFDEIESIALKLELGELESNDDRVREAFESLSSSSSSSSDEFSSSNETLIDVKTKDLKYLLFDYYKAQFEISMPSGGGGEARLKALERVSAYYWKFLDRHESDYW